MFSGMFCKYSIFRYTGSYVQVHQHLQKGRSIRLSGRQRIFVKTSKIVTISIELRRPPASWPLRSIDTTGNVMADRRSAGTRSISYVPVLVVAW